MSYRQPPRAVENYTTPFWVTVGAIFFMGAWLIATLYGFSTVLIVAAGIDLAVKFVARRIRDT